MDITFSGFGDCRPSGNHMSLILPRSPNVTDLSIEYYILHLCSRESKDRYGCRGRIALPVVGRVGCAMQDDEAHPW
jgi:hypothetical protein